VGGEGDWDYLYADAAGRRLYIIREVESSERSTAAGSADATRLSIFDLDTLRPLGAIAGVGGHGTAVDPKTGHGFTSSNPVSMFDTRTMKLLKTIPVAPTTDPDGIYFDSSDERVYVVSHPTRDATVIDARQGTVLGTIKLGGRPEQAVADGHGKLYVVLQDEAGSVAVVDEHAMKTTGHFSLGDAGGCNGLAFDVSHQVLFAACARSGARDKSMIKVPWQPINPVMVVMSATDGRILAKEPMPSGSDGATFNPQTMEAFSTNGNGTLTVVKEISPTSFQVEQNLETMDGARTVTFDSKTQHLFTMADKRAPGPITATEYPPAIPGTFTILEVGR
jgi:DNA-binding beta-propeller fold protein YncE